MFAAHADFVFRACRRFGLDEATAEDATQQVFIVLSRKLASVPLGKERAFLYLTASHVSSNARRSLRRRREEYREGEDVAAPHPLPDAMLEHSRLREVADHILEQMDADLRAAFVLYEIEEMTFAEIAEVLGIPRGTVASRVRRARDEFEAHVKRAIAKGEMSR